MEREIMIHLVARLLQNAEEAKNNKNDNEFEEGRSEAYYEMLDILKSELDGYGEQLSDYGLDTDLLQFA